MKKIISFVLALALVASVAIMPASAASFSEAAGESDRFYPALQYVEENEIYQDADVEGENVKAWLEGDATRVEYALWLARFAGADLTGVAAASESAVTYTLDTTADLAEMAAGAKADGETESVADYFTVHYGAKTKIDGSNKSFEDGYQASQRLNFQGKTVFGDTVSYAVSFTTSAAATVKIWWVSGGDGREFTLFDSEGNVLSATAEGSVKNSLYISELSVDAAGTYYLGLESGSNYLFKLEVTEAASSEESGSSELIFPDMEAYVGTEKYAAVAWGTANGYIYGYSDGLFYPDKPISREEMCALIARYFRANDWAGLEATDNITVFIDQDEFSQYTIDAQNVVDCVKYGLITGRECGRFDAKHIENGETVYTTRQQVAAIFYRAGGHPLNTTKIYAELNAGVTAFSVRMNEHYTVELKFASGAISANKISVNAEVGPLPSIGLNSKYSASKSISTGISEKIDLQNFLSNCYSFAGATVNTDIDGITFTYEVWPAEVTDDGLTTVYFLADNACEARDAWNRLADTISLESNDGSNYTIITNGSSLQIGEQIAEFKRGKSDWTIDSTNTASLKEQFNEMIKIDTDTDAKIELILEKGITVAAGSRAAKLNEDVTLTVEGIYAYELGEAVVALLAEDVDIQSAGLDLISAVNALFGEMSGNNDITVTVEIG